MVLHCLSSVLSLGLLGCGREGARALDPIAACRWHEGRFTSGLDKRGKVTAIGIVVFHYVTRSTSLIQKLLMGAVFLPGSRATSLVMTHGNYSDVYVGGRQLADTSSAVVDGSQLVEVGNITE